MFNVIKLSEALDVHSDEKSPSKKSWARLCLNVLVRACGLFISIYNIYVLLLL